VSIWTPEGHLTLGGFPVKACVLHTGFFFFPEFVFLGFLVV